MHAAVRQGHTMADIEFIMTTQDSIELGSFLFDEFGARISIDDSATRGAKLGGDGQWTLDAGRFAEKAEEQNQY